MKQLAPSVINTDAGKAAQNRARQAAETARAIERAKAKLWRLERTLEQCRPEKRARFERRVEAQKRRIIEIGIQGSKPGRAIRRIPRHRSG